MANRRGPVISLIGLGMLAASFLIAFMAIPDQNPTLGSTITTTNLLDDMFDKTTQEVSILPENSYSFTHDVQNPQVPLIWGIQLTDFSQESSRLSVGVTDAHNGEKIKVVEVNRPFIFDVVSDQNVESYSFEVTNKGTSQATVIMMFTENSDGLNIFNQDSELSQIMLPVLVSGFLLILGIVIVAIGVILLFLDWRRNKNKSEYV